jgi:hypothetical protein
MLTITTFFTAPLFVMPVRLLLGTVGYVFGFEVGNWYAWLAGSFGVGFVLGLWLCYDECR